MHVGAGIEESNVSHNILLKLQSWRRVLERLKLMEKRGLQLDAATGARHSSALNSGVSKQLNDIIPRANEVVPSLPKCGFAARGASSHRRSH